MKQMTIRDRKSMRDVFCVLAPVMAAYLIRLLLRTKPDTFFWLMLSLLRSTIYIGLFFGWGLSLRRRIIQPQVRHYLSMTAGLMVFWIVVRTIKYMLASDLNLTRYLWYLFYLPMLLLPVCGLYIALSLSKPEEYRLPRWTGVFAVVGVALFLLVLTNDAHQLVFRFAPNVAVLDPNQYTRAAGYYFTCAWEGGCVLATVFLIFRKSRLPGSGKRIVLPIFFCGVLMLYAVLYIIDEPSLKAWLGDMNTFSCVMIVAILESCIGQGLIPSNAYHRDLFSAALGVSAQITDKSYHIRFATAEAEAVSEEQMRAAEQGPILLDRAKRLHNMAIDGGHAIWQQDISDLLRLRERLTDVQQTLTDRNALLRCQYEKERERQSVAEQNRLYDLLQSSTQKQTDQISTLVRGYQAADADARRTILACVAVLCSFVKRRKHLALSVYHACRIAESEFTAALQECINTLRLLGVRGNLFVQIEKAYLAGQTAILAYDFFEAAIETARETLHSFLVSVAVVQNRLRICISLFCENDMTVLLKDYPDAKICHEDEGEWSLVLPLGDEGWRV